MGFFSVKCLPCPHVHT
ncbi:unnamed protein product, partial [Arabidopsis lyrata]